ncbi:hypothetical protein AB9K41_26000 [Cribrihabitans sp. XS_ASV171]
MQNRIEVGRGQLRIIALDLLVQDVEPSQNARAEFLVCHSVEVFHGSVLVSLLGCGERSTVYGRPAVSGCIVDLEGERPGIPGIVQFADLDEEIVEPVGDETELLLLRAGRVEKYSGREVGFERVDDRVE